MAKRIKNKFYPAAMSVAASNPCGKSGVAADLRTFNAFGVFGTCAVTAVMAGENRFAALVDAENVEKQMKKVLEKIAVGYVRTGMLLSAEMVSAVAAEIKKNQLNLVCDPVISRKDAESDFAGAMDELFSLAQWITPGIPEAEIISGSKIASLADMIGAAKVIAERFQCNVLLKGGKLPEALSTDVVVKDNRVYTLSSPALELPAGTSFGAGSALSAALTAMLTLDFSWKQAVCSAKAFAYGSLCQMVEIGAGVNVMYPPTEDYSSFIKLAEAE